MARIKDITGQRFGMLTVVEEEKDRSKCPTKSPNGPLWLCVCDCGNEKYVYGNRLKLGINKSCGCLLKKRRDLNSSDKQSGHPNTSGHVGVYKAESDKVWFATIYLNGKSCNIGRFSEFEDAVLAREQAVKMYVTDTGVKTSEFDRLAVLKAAGLEDKVLMFRNVNKSGYPGITWNKKDSVWQTGIRINNTKHYIGSFKDLDDAINVQTVAKDIYLPKNKDDINFVQSEFSRELIASDPRLTGIQVLKRK